MTVKRHSLAYNHVALTLPVQAEPYRICALSVAGTVSNVAPIYRLTVLDGSGEQAWSGETQLDAGRDSVVWSVNAPRTFLDRVSTGYLPPDLWIMPTDSVVLTASEPPDVSLGGVVLTTQDRT